jgi:hypothetical protein
MSRNFVDGYKWNNISELIAILEEIKKRYGEDIRIEKDEYPGSTRSINVDRISIIQNETYIDEETETYTLIF